MIGERVTPGHCVFIGGVGASDPRKEKANWLWEENALGR